MQAVTAQLRRMPLSSQELLDPLRGALAGLLGEITPGALQYACFSHNGPDAGEAVPHLHCHILGGRKMTWPPG